MKKWITLFVAAALIGFFCFGLMRWLFGGSAESAAAIGLAAGTGGLAGEAARLFQESRRRKAVHPNH